MRERYGYVTAPCNYRSSLFQFSTTSRSVGASPSISPQPSQAIAIIGGLRQSETGIRDELPQEQGLAFCISARTAGSVMQGKLEKFGSNPSSAASSPSPPMARENSVSSFLWVARSFHWPRYGRIVIGCNSWRTLRGSNPFFKIENLVS